MQDRDEDSEKSCDRYCTHYKTSPNLHCDIGCPQTFIFYHSDCSHYTREEVKE